MLFKLTIATIFHRKSWAICAFAILILPFVLPYISTAVERPVLVQPARIQAAWSILWIASLVWGLFTAAKEGERNAQSGIGEYFQTTGIGGTGQLLQIWLAVFAYILPMVMITVLISQFGARPNNPAESDWWLTLNLQYAVLMMLVLAPLIALAIALASRFGGITGFSITLLLAVYGLYGVGLLENLANVESKSSIFRNIILFSPHYRFADLTQRLYFKSGALSPETFGSMVIYFLAICAMLTGVSRLIVRSRANY